MAKENTFLCGCCKQGFNSERAVTDHITASHKGKATRIYRTVKLIDLRDKCEREPSMAELTIEAEMNKNMGLPYEAWLLGEA